MRHGELYVSAPCGKEGKFQHTTEWCVKPTEGTAYCLSQVDFIYIAPSCSPAEEIILRKGKEANQRLFQHLPSRTFFYFDFILTSKHDLMQRIYWTNYNTSSVHPC